MNFVQGRAKVVFIAPPDARLMVAPIEKMHPLVPAVVGLACGPPATRDCDLLSVTCDDVLGGPRVRQQKESKHIYINITKYTHM